MVLSSQLRAARALLGWGVDHLADASGVTVADIERLETRLGTIPADVPGLREIIVSLEKGGVLLINEQSGPGVRFSSPPSERVYTDEADTVQYKEYLENDAPPGAGG